MCQELPFTRKCVSTVVTVEGHSALKLLREKLINIWQIHKYILGKMCAKIWEDVVRKGLDTILLIE